MAIREILKQGEPALSKVCHPVTVFDQKLWDLLDDMKETLADAGGLGLAGPQVGILRRVAIVVNEKDEMLELVNPEIIAQQGEQDGLEGCLSVPGLWGFVKRPAWVKVKALDRNGKEIWRFEVVHPTRAVEVADIDGDGKPEVLCGTRYMWATVLDHQGNKLWGGRFGVGCRAIAAPLNGQGKTRNVVIGIDSGKVTFHDRNGQEFNSFLTGDEIFMMDTAVPRNGREDVFVASYNGYVYRFAPDGKLVWCRALPDSVVVVRALPDGGAVAGTIGGDVCILTPDGKIRGQVKFHGRIADILVDGKELRVVSQGGEIATLNF